MEFRRSAQEELRRRRLAGQRLVGQATSRFLSAQHQHRQVTTQPIRLPEIEQRAVYRILNFALRSGALMLASGAGTVEVESTIGEFARACGLRRVEVDVTFTSLTASYIPGRDVEPVTTLRVVRHREVDYGRLTAIYALRDEMKAGQLTTEQAISRLDEIATKPPRRNPLILLGWAGMAAAFSVLLGGWGIAAPVAFVSTIIAYLAMQWGAGRGMLGFFQTALAAAVATGAALALAAMHAPAQSSLVVAGGIMVLEPGYALVASVQDALTGFPISGSARGLEVLLTAAGIVSGIALMLYVGHMLGISIGVAAVSSGSLLRVPAQVAAAGVAATLYATATSVPARALAWSGVTGAAGWAAALLLENERVSPIFAAAVAAWLVGVVGRTVASRQGTHPFLYVVPGIMPLVPGLTIYGGMLTLIDGNDPGGIALLLRALAVGLAIAAGVTLGHTVIRPIRRTQHAAG